MTILRSLGFCSALIFSAGALSPAVYAQAVDESALEALDQKTPAVVPNIVEPAGAVELRDAMRRISFNPSDADALADAGNAALLLGDANAALNFFTRANAIRPNNSRIVAGLATATVRTENPFEALRLFDDAVRLGADQRSIAADRALAFDLLGNFGRAQQDYQLARTVASSDDIIIRQAVSLSLAGQKEQADAMLLPLLQRNSPAAWRARAFMLAARGDLRESNKVAEGFMDATSAQKMERFFRLMPNLTGAQQAAAIHLGHFPTSQAVGRDSEQVRRVAATVPQPAIAPAQNRLIPSGAPLGTKPTAARDVKSEAKPQSKPDRRAQERVEVQAAVPTPPRPDPLVAQVELAATVAGTTPTAQEPVSLAAATPPQPAPAKIIAAPTAVPASTATASAGFSLDAIVGAIEIPESEQRPSEVPVDLKKLKPVTPKAAADASKAAKLDPKAAAKAKLEAANPARIWVQIATGEAGGLGFDYRKLTKNNPALFKAQKPWTSPWGRTARLLVGPFPDVKAAKKWEGDFKKAGGDAFMWKSEIGVPVNALKVK
ncbi:tetratricopeptide repeat protein [Sphingorhabdus sp.]|uniref:tetratricopeptide repeat protein n=1 Tax=Sphingorhabdus sp. TaxID=1902408 RepID=UPI0037849957